MAGLLCSVQDAGAVGQEAAWRRGLQLAHQHPEHVVEQYSEPGFQLACLYHPESMSGPRILVTERYVIAHYGNLHEDDWAAGPATAPRCAELLERFVAQGAGALEHLDGRYDIAVWDRRDRILHLVSDRFGINRHYVLRQDAALHIACEVKALAAHLQGIDPDPAALASMMLFGYHTGDLTVLSGIRCLPNARHVEYHGNDHRYTLKRYWDYPYGEADVLQGSEDELAGSLYGLLEKALARQLHGVRKVLLPISGGLDSRTLAGLLARSGFDGEVLAYSYGQPGSRDVRYGRAVARRLGYRHVHVPTPPDFLVHGMAEEAWHTDAEWVGVINWSNLAYTHPALGDTRGFTVLSGMYGDMLLGADRFNCHRRLGEQPRSAAELRDAYIRFHQDYATPDAVRGLLLPEYADDAMRQLGDVILESFSGQGQLLPYHAMIKAEFQHRQRRYTASIVQRLDNDRHTATPFLDRAVVDFSVRIPFRYFHLKKLYKQMLCRYLPEVAAIPYGDTGWPLLETSLQRALHWRLERLMKRFPRVKQALDRRNAFFDFDTGVLSQAAYFRSEAPLLSQLSPPLSASAIRQRYDSLLAGQIRPADGICTILPAALYLHRLRLEMADAGSVAAGGSANEGPGWPVAG